MIKYEREELEEKLFHTLGESSMLGRSMCDYILSVIDRQLKYKQVITDGDKAFCPKCGADLSKEFGYAHCHRCGQAVGWPDNWH